MYTVYRHINKINNKMYIGITAQKPENRWGASGSNYKGSPYFYNAINKYGWDNFIHEVLYINLTQEEACTLEKSLIAEYCTDNPSYGYNCTTGGEKSFKMNEISRKKKSQAMMGNKNGQHPCREDTKEKIRAAQKGKKLTPEHIQKLKQGAVNRKTVPCTEEKKKKLQNNHPAMKKIYCVETDTVYKSINECARALNLHASNISGVCRGKHAHTKGYHFKYYD